MPIEPLETLSRTIGPGDVQAGPERRRVPALALLWARDEAERVGEVLLLERGVRVLLGRSDGPAAGVLRGELVRQRPGRVEPTGPLRSARVSRDQLVLRADADGEIRVENVGRCPLLVNGQEATVATVGPGDRLELLGQVGFLVTERPVSSLPWPEGLPLPRFPFGSADPAGIVGESEAAWKLREEIAFLAPRSGHVLVRGESGTGKELVAQALHGGSGRAGRTFVARNAATIPDSLVDAELFGNARNYPNPGMAERPGLIGEADGGTLFLDEFGELPPSVQAHLLRVLDAGEYQRLGDARPRRSDFRLIAATNRPESALKEDVLARFRLRVVLPGLADRPEDVPLLAVHVLRRAARGDRAVAERCFPDGDVAQLPRVTPALVEALVARPWRTHVRELEAVLWAAIAKSRGGALEPPDEPAPPPSSRGSASTPTVDPLDIPADVLQAVLDKHDGAQEPAWRELGFSSRHVLTRLVRRYGLRVRGRTRGDP